MSPNTRNVVLYGDDLDYILFQIAIKYPQEGCSVWYIAPAPIQALPAGINKPPRKEIQKLMTFLYLNNAQKLMEHLNSAHTWQNTPSLIILTGLESYYNWGPSGNNATLNAFITATLLDAVAACSKKNERKCSAILASNTLSECKLGMLQDLCDVYFENVISKENQDADQILLDVIDIIK